MRDPTPAYTLRQRALVLSFLEATYKHMITPAVTHGALRISNVGLSGWVGRGSA